MTTIPLFLAANAELVAVTTVVSTILSIFFVIMSRRGRLGEHCLPDPPSVDKKLVPRKLCRKVTTKKKRNRGTTWLFTLQQVKNMDCQIEGQNKEDASEELDQRRCRHKKSRHISKSSGDSPGNQQKIVKLYSPLPLFLSLKLDPLALYCRFIPYVLCKEQLILCGFPLDSPENPGKVILAGNIKSPIELEDPTERWCCRCGAKFSISEDGQYEADSVCRYHWGKRLSLGGVAGAGPYSCCSQDSHTEGCTWSKHHVTSQIAQGEIEFVKTRYKRLPYPCLSHRIYALDCEMCYTMQGLEVARISVVGTDGLAIYDSYVLPENPVLDYNTAYSGITANDLKDVTTTLRDVQAFLLKLLNSRTILVGHGLENDLKALRVIHETIVDTSVVFPHQYGFPYKMSLKSLAATYLQRTIQEGEGGHDSVEDARTCIELMLWKVQSEKQHIEPQGLLPLPIPCAQPWLMGSCPPCANPFLAPYSVGYWVPPVGSCCELC